MILHEGMANKSVHNLRKLTREERETLEENIKLLAFTYNKYFRHIQRETPDELIQEGYFGMHMGIISYNDNREKFKGTTLSGHLVRNIRWAILNYLNHYTDADLFRIPKYIKTQRIREIKADELLENEELSQQYNQVYNMDIVYLDSEITDGTEYSGKYSNLVGSPHSMEGDLLTELNESRLREEVYNLAEEFFKQGSRQKDYAVIKADGMVSVIIDGKTVTDLSKQLGISRQTLSLDKNDFLGHLRNNYGIEYFI